LDDLQYITVPTSFSVKNKNHYVLLYHCPDATDRVATESLCIQWAIKKAQEKELTLWALPYLWDKESVSSHGISVTAHNILIKNYFAQTQQRLPFFINSVDKFLFTLSFPVEARLFFVRSLQFESLQKWFQKQGKIMQENFEFVFLTKETLRFYYEELRDCNATFHEANFVPMVLHPQDKNNHIRLFRSFFYNDIDEKNKILIVKERITKRIVGMIYLSTMPQEIKQETTHEHSVYLSNFWIADSYRGKSLGKALIYLMTQKAQEQNPGGFIHTVLCNITGSDSYGFFQKIGLEEKESSIDIIQDLVKEEILVQLQKNC
jgi:ribosomal protein S18 acetylase RimI-like enzyme